MKHLKLTLSENPIAPNDGLPYVYYNEHINKVWIFTGLKWILEDGRWNMERQWCDTGTWRFYPLD